MDRLGLLAVRRLSLRVLASSALALSFLVPAGGFALIGPVAAASPEACPAGTTNVAQFQWSGGAWAAVGDAAGLTVSGDTTLARWVRSGGTISAVLLTAGAVTINYTYDPRAWNGAVAASDVEAAGGAPLSEIDFCSGALVSPSSGSTISVGLTKTAGCATLGSESATVSGTITVIRHRPNDPSAPSISIRVRTTRDNVWAGGAWLGETTTISGLTSAVMAPGTDTLQVPYTVSFNAGKATAFTNKIEITIEQAVSGLDRHKYYSATATFGVCAAATPTPEGSVSASTPTPKPEGSVAAATPTVRASVPNTATGSGPGNGGSTLLPLLIYAFLFLGSGGLLIYARRSSGR